MSIDITYEDFVKACPVGETPDNDMFTRIRDHIEPRLFLMRGLVTPDIYDRLDILATETPEPYARIRSLIVAYACVSALNIAIPQLDLVYTPTGFGVVSNDNVAPASAERVAALRSQLLEREDHYLDELVDTLRPVVDWSKSTHGQYLFSSLFWKADHMKLYGYEQPSRTQLMAMQPAIQEAAMKISRVISPELYNALVKAESRADTTPRQQALIHMCRQASASLDKRSFEWRSWRMSLLAYIENYLSDFPEYAESSTYRANHAQNYENKKDDPCFFFG